MSRYEDAAIRLHRDRADTGRAYHRIYAARSTAPSITLHINDELVTVLTERPGSEIVLTLEDPDPRVVTDEFIARVYIPGWTGYDELGHYATVAVYVQGVMPSVTLVQEGAPNEAVELLREQWDSTFKYELSQDHGVGQWINNVSILNGGLASHQVIAALYKKGVALPWFSIIIALLTFFGSKKNGASNTKALLTAGLAGAGSYYVTHETEWGRANLGALDGVVPTGAVPLEGAGGAVVDANGNPVRVGVNPTGETSVAGEVGGVLKSWGGTGTAAVIGTTAAATSGFFSSPAFKWILGGGIALLILSR